MHTSTVLWALQIFSSWNTCKWAVTALLFSAHLRKKEALGTGCEKGIVSCSSWGAPWEFWSQIGKRLKNCMLPRNGICPDLSPALSQDGSNSLHKITYIHRSSSLPCPTWWGLLSQSHSQAHALSSLGRYSPHGYWKLRRIQSFLRAPAPLLCG